MRGDGTEYQEGPDGSALNMPYSRSYGTPALSPRFGRLFIAALDAGPEAAIGEWLRAQGFAHEANGDGLFSATVDQQTLDAFCDALPFIVSEKELEDVRLLLRATGEMGFSHRELLRMDPAMKFIAVHRAQWLVQ